MDAGENDDDRTHNDVNEITGRDTDDNGTDNYTLAYTKLGQLRDDGQNYEYEFDGFGRLRKVRNTSNQALVSEYWYNGLGHRIGWKSGFHARREFGFQDRGRILGGARL